MKVIELTPATQEFLEQLQSQMEGDVLMLFNAVLRNLEKLSPEVRRRLDKLNALEAGGVDNWEWYDDAMETLEEDEDD